MIPQTVRVFVCTEPVDMRHGFDRLVQTGRERAGHDPQQGGALFVFANRRTTRLKILWFERNGLCVLYKRLHRAVFEIPVPGEGGRIALVDGAALARLLAGVSRSERGIRKNGS